MLASTVGSASLQCQPEVSLRTSITMHSTHAHADQEARHSCSCHICAQQLDTYTVSRDSTSLINKIHGYLDAQQERQPACHQLTQRLDPCHPSVQNPHRLCCMRLLKTTPQRWCLAHVLWSEQWFGWLAVPQADADSGLAAKCCCLCGGRGLLDCYLHMAVV